MKGDGLDQLRALVTLNTPKHIIYRWSENKNFEPRLALRWPHWCGLKLVNRMRMRTMRNETPKDGIYLRLALVCGRKPGEWRAVRDACVL